MFALLSVLLAAAPQTNERPLLIASVRVTPFTGWPDLAGVSATIHLIPYFDVEGGGAFGLTQTWFVRGGPRFLFEDWRDEQHKGFTLRMSALGGYKAVALRDVRFGGFHFAGALELTGWLAAHVGLTMQLSGGGTVRSWPSFFPELKLAFGAAF